MDKLPNELLVHIVKEVLDTPEGGPPMLHNIKGLYLVSRRFASITLDVLLQSRFTWPHPNVKVVSTALAKNREICSRILRVYTTVPDACVQEDMDQDSRTRSGVKSLLQDIGELSNLRELWVSGQGPRCSRPRKRPISLDKPSTLSTLEGITIRENSPGFATLLAFFPLLLQCPNLSYVKIQYRTKETREYAIFASNRSAPDIVYASQTPACISDFVTLITIMSKSGYTAVAYHLPTDVPPRAMLDMDSQLWSNVRRLLLGSRLDMMSPPGSDCTSLAPFLRKLPNLKSIEGHLILPSPSHFDSIFTLLSTFECRSSLQQFELYFESPEEIGPQFEWEQVINPQIFPALRLIDIDYVDTIQLCEPRVTYTCFLSNQLKALSASYPSITISLGLELQLHAQADDKVAQFGAWVEVQQGQVKSETYFDQYQRCCGPGLSPSVILDKLKDGGWEREVRSLLQLDE